MLLLFFFVCCFVRAVSRTKKHVCVCSAVVCCVCLLFGCVLFVVACNCVAMFVVLFELLCLQNYVCAIRFLFVAFVCCLFGLLVLLVFVVCVVVSLALFCDQKHVCVSVAMC